jgi:hypothetical protein
VTTPEQALDAARRYVAEERGYCHVAGLLEDESDYYIRLELNDPRMQWPLGPGPLFVSKATGEVWGDAFGNVLDKIDGMEPVR